MVTLRPRYSIIYLAVAAIALFSTCFSAFVTFAKYGFATISGLIDVQFPRLSDNLVLVGEPNSNGIMPLNFERTYRNRAAARNV
jgi:hypothetical protein